MKTKQAPSKTSRAIFLLPLVLAIFTASDASAQLYYQTNGTNATWTGAVWNTTGTGTFSSAWVSGTNVVFGVANGGTNNVYLATTTIGDITVNGNTLVSTNTSSSTISSKSGGSTVTVADGVSFTFSGANMNWSSTAANFNWTKAGNGTWDLGTISGTAGAGAVGFTLNAGTLISRGNGNFGGANGTLTINGGLFAWSASRNWANAFIFGGNFGISNVTANTNGFAGAIGLSGIRTITNSASENINFNGAITNVSGFTGGLVFTNTGTGTGTIRIAGANTFSGGVTLNSGAIRLGSTTALGTGTFAINGGSFDTSVAQTNANNNAMTWGGNFSFAGTANLDLGTGAVNLAANSAVTVTANQLTVGGAVTNTGQLTKNGAGTLLLNAAGTYNGGTVLNAGTLLVGSSSALGSGSLTVNGGTLASSVTSRTLANSVIVGGDFALGGQSFLTRLNGNVDLGGAARTITFSNGGTFGGNITNGSLTIAVNSASREIIITNSGNFNGTNLTLRGGSLIVGGTGTIGSSVAVDLTAASHAATNDISNISASGLTYGSLAGAANSAVVLGAKNLSVGGLNTSSSFAGAMSGAGGSFTKTGTGTVTFSGTSTYNGATTVSGGRFVMNGTNSSSAVTASAGASVGGSGQIGALTVSGTVAPGTSVGTLTAGNTVFDKNGFFELEMYKWDGTAGTDWDRLVVGGSLTLSNTFANPFTINLVSMVNPTTPGLSTSWNPDANWTNNFVSFTTLANTFDGTAFSVNTGSFSNSINGSFSVIQNGTNLALLYTTAFVPSAAFNWNTGSGDWNVAGNWTNGAVPTNGNSVVFSGSGGNSTNNAVTSVKGIVFSNAASGSYIISGNAITNGVDGIVNNSSSAQTISSAITLGIGQTFDAASGSLSFDGSIDTAGLALVVQGSANTTINGAITGSGGSLSKAGTGSLFLNGTNTYSGGTTLSAGTLVGDSTSLQGAIANSATLVFVQATNGAYGSVVSGAGTLIKQGSGSLTLNGANTYSGGTLVSGGALVGDTTTMRGPITNNATIVYNQTTNGTNSSLITGSGALIKAGADTLTLNNNTNSMGSITVSAGVLRMRSTNSVNSVTVAGGATLDYGTALNTPLGTATITLQNGAIFGQGASMGATTNDRIIGNNLVLAGNVQFGGLGFGSYFGGNIDLGGVTRNITFANSTDIGGVISNGTGLVVDSGGSATRTFSLTNGVATYSGATTNNGGIIALVGSGALPTGTALNLAGATTNATLDISAVSGSGVTLGSLAGSSTAVVTNTGKNLNVGSDNSSTTFAGAIRGTGGSLTKSGNGTLTLTGANTYSGGTLVSAGALAGDSTSLRNAITNDSRVIFDQVTNGTYSGAMTGSGGLTKNSAGTLTLSGANAYSGGTVINAGTLAGSTTSLQGAISNSANVEFNQSTNGTYSGVVSGSGSLTKSGSGVVTLSGANTYAGGTVVSAGGLTGDTTSLQGAISNGGTVTFAQSGNGSYGGTLSGAGSLVKSGSGTVTLSGANGSFSGAVTVGGGSLTATVDNALGTGSVTVTNGGVIANNGRSIGNNFVLGTAGAGGVYYSQDFNTMGLTAPTGWSIYTNASTNSLGTASSITSSNTWGNTTGGFYNYASTTGLTSAATTTEQNNSTNRALGVRQSSTFGDPGASFGYTFNTLNQNVTSISLDLLMLSAQPRGSTWNIEYGLGTNPTSFTLLGTWADPGVWGATSTNFTTNTFGSSLDNQANIVFRFTALNATTNTGNRDTIGIDNFVINTAQPATGSGTLGIQEAGSATFSGNVTVNNAGTLTAAANAQATFSGVLSGAGGITKTGSGTVILSGNNSYSGGTTVSDGELRGTSSSLQGPITNNARVVFDQSASGTYSGGMSGNGVLVKEGSGTLQLAANTYAGGTLLNGGVITLAGNTALGTGIVTIGNGTVLGSVTSQRTLANNFVAAGNFTLGIGAQATTFNGGFDLGGATRTISLDNSATFNGVISNGGLVINNINATNRNMILAAANTFGGGITLNSGNLRLNHVNGAGIGSVTQTDGSSQIQVNVAGTITNDMSVWNVAYWQGANLSGALALNNTVFDVTNNVTATNSGTLSGMGGVDKIGAGTLVLSGNNSYTGGTSISNGAVSVSADANLGAVPVSPTAGNVTLDGGKLLATSGFTLDSNRGVSLGASGGTMEVASGQTLSYGGVAAGSGALTKSGIGTMTLTGANTYSGATIVDAGTVQLANTGGEALGSTASISVSSGATLLISQNNQVNNSAAVTLSGGTIRTAAGVGETFGNLTVTGSGFLDFGTTSYANANTINFGTYTPSALLTIANFDFGSTLTFKSNLTSTINDLSFFSFSNGGIASSSWDEGTSTFTITAIPEPSTYLAAAGLLALMLWPSRRRLLKDAKSVLGLRAPARDRLVH